MSDALLSTLAEALAELVTVVETSDDEDLDPDTAVKWLESTAYTLGRLGAADRRTLDGLFREAALRQPEGPWRDELLKVSEGFGLTEGPAGVAHAAACEAALETARRFAATVRAADPATPVPTCPGWTLADLTRHLGTVHHWAGHLVRTRATVRVLARDVPLDLPADPAAYPDWLAAGAERFAATAREADPDAPVWSPGADPHVRHYPRHVLFETLVHLADAELAVAGTAGPLDPGTAADAIDHFLGNAPYIPWIAEPLAHLDRDGAVLRLAARDTGAVWTLALGGGGFTWTRGTDGGEPTAGVAADTGELLLLLHRRYAADDPRFTHTGDRDLLDDWLAATAL
ncbi:maleylpyruvate isomerase family mycothiol-dependent enzyme [Streptomyces sp. NPDC002825]|uniref:maleylpyruvate isomerase family mycothiol-dependent enzyme n=1 Tax=Streptomyces sp. NPDC002825 TaxID=3154666 RepID=UPI00331A4726